MNVGDVNTTPIQAKLDVCLWIIVPLISIDIWCKAGSSFEDVDKNALLIF